MVRTKCGIFRVQNRWSGCVSSIFGCKSSSVPSYGSSQTRPISKWPDFHNESGEPRWCPASVFHVVNGDLPSDVHTVNIHSHFWGAILFIILLATFQTKYVAVYETTTWVDTCIVAVFLVSGVFCLSASATYHTSTCHHQEVSFSQAEPVRDTQTRQVSVRCHALDYIGIIGQDVATTLATKAHC